jgi:MFS family permease
VPVRSRLLADIGPLRESPAFRRLWAGTTLSAVGSALTGFAVILQVYDLTRSPLAVGAIGLAQMVPTLAIGLLGGSLTDAADRRKLVLVTSAGLAAVSAAFAAQAFAGLRLAWLLYALVAVQSSLSALDRPARSTFVPRLLPASQVPAGLALTRLTFQITLTAGAALAGLIAAAPHLGLRACYLIDAISFAFALYGVARLPAMRPQAGAPRPGLRAVAEGVGFIRRSRVLAGAFLADLNATVFGLPAALFPAINAERFGGDPRMLGLFTTAVGLGGLASVAFSGPVRHVSRPGRAMLCAVAVWGGAFAGFAVSPGPWPTLSLLAVAGAADTFTVVFRGVILQAGTPDQLRGRVMAVEYVVGAGGGHMGDLEAGALGTLTSPTISALSGGLVTIAGAVVIGLALPAFTRYRYQPHDLTQTSAPGPDGGGSTLTPRNGRRPAGRRPRRARAGTGEAGATGPRAPARPAAPAGGGAARGGPGGSARPRPPVPGDP